MLESRVVSFLRRAKTLPQQLRSCPRGPSSGVGRPLLPALGPAAASKASGSPLQRWGALHRFRCLTKGLFGQPSRKMTTSASLPTFGKSEVVSEGLKLLVSEGSAAQKKIGIWLFGCSAWVFSLVVLGGVTRLTRSGLSMTDWKFTGGLPPLSEEEWQLEFQKYQQSPEYKRVNRGMRMEDFKFIYWMEYAHRMWGRGLGIVFGLPFAYFLAKGFITCRLGLRLSGLFALGAGQGLVGWWMVKSGLEEPASEYVQPRVSPYRLAAHLTSAFVIYCGLLWTALSVVMPEPPAGNIKWVHGAAKVGKLVLPVSVIVGITAVSGAFVAGNDAGHAYNTFPKMGDSWIPDDIFSMEPLFRNFFENTSTVLVSFSSQSSYSRNYNSDLSWWFVVSYEKNRHASSNSIFNQKYIGNGSTSGHFGDINTPVICSSFPSLSPPSWCIDFVVSCHPLGPYSKEAISSASQIIGFIAKMQLLVHQFCCAAIFTGI